VPAAPASEFARQWAQLTAALGSLEHALREELRQSWRDLAALLADQAAAEAAVAPPRDAGLGAFSAARSAASRAVLLDAADRWQRLRPLKRADLAVETFHRGLDELVRRLPVSVGVTGADLPGTLGPVAGPALARRMAAMRRAPAPVPLQAVVARAFARAESLQLRVEGRCLYTLAQGLQEIRRAWERARARVDESLASPSAPRAVPRPDGPALREGLEATFTQALGELDQAFLVARRLAGAGVVRALAWRRRVRPPAAPARRHRQFEHWAVQLGSLEAELRFERAQDGVERRLLALGERTCAALEAERRGLEEGIERFLRWLDDALAGRADPSDPPRVTPPIVPALRRTTDLAVSVRQILDALPDEVELVRRLEPVPRRRASRKAITPDRMATEAFDRVGRSRFEVIFADVQDGHVALVQQIERARQVVEFAAEREGSADDASVAREALENARSLLAGDQAAAAASFADERAVVARALADTFLQNRLLLTRSRLGALAHLGRLGARQGLGAAAAAALPALRRGLGDTRRGAARLWRRFLVAIQWMPASDTRPPDVVRRPWLPREFTLDPREKDLPAIYRRLFRFEAVDDPRFLVGRDREMQALAEARELWEAGRPVAVLVVGERGSGKTSLVNCAVEGPLEGLAVVRGEFGPRLAGPAAVREFLAGLLGLPDPAGLEAALQGGRRVLVLEETERTFLREIGGFGGVRELQRLIAATAATTLWVLVINQHAFRFLDAAVRLGASFSHRLDAARASARAVRDAILVRHNLSGLRLRFVRPASERGRLARLRRRVRGAADPEQLFFDGLARESAGVFRTAFELWLGQIDAVHAGTLVMKPMGAPDVDAVIEQLDADDLFTLVAVMQHGSLTAEEHARVFRWNPEASRAQLDDLLAREIIEPEPTRPGFRVRPGALRVAREALHRRNLGS
jgi:hypothetical protein